MCFHSTKLCAYIAPNLFLPAVNGYRRSFGRIHLTVQQNLQFLNSKPRPNSIWVEIKEQPKKAFHQLQGDWQKSWQRFFTQNSLCSPKRVHVSLISFVWHLETSTPQYLRFTKSPTSWKMWFWNNKLFKQPFRSLCFFFFGSNHTIHRNKKKQFTIKLRSVRSTCTTPILFESPCYGNIWVSHIWKQPTKLPWTRVGRSPERTSTTMTNANKNPRWGTTVLPMQGKNFGENQLTYLHPGSPRPFK